MNLKMFHYNPNYLYFQEATAVIFFLNGTFLFVYDNFYWFQVFLSNPNNLYAIIWF